MTAAQKTAKANFKKAIEYRKKTGVSLKEAFAHVYGKKVGAAPKKKATKKAAPKKAAKKVVKKAAPKKIAKKAAPKKHTKYGKVKAHTRRVAGLKKKVSEQSVLKKIHKVKDQVSQLDELQHKHMSGLPKYRNAVRVYFNNPKYNYTTAVGPNVTEESAKQYFLGKYFNVGVYPKEILQKPTRIKFFRYIDK
jgi:hypothetical protein